MWNVIATGWESEPPNLSRAGKSESQPNRLAQSDVGPEPGWRVKKWSSGFVKPDGTQIRLFVSPSLHARAS